MMANESINEVNRELTEAEQREERLRQEILAEARQKGDRLLARARNEADQMRQQQLQEIEEKRTRLLAETDASVEKQLKSFHQETDSQIRALWLKLREAEIDTVLQSCLKEACAQTGDARHDSYLALAKEALVQLGYEEKFTVRLPAKDRETLSSAELEKLAVELWGDNQGKKVAFEMVFAEETADGVTISAEEGRVVFENSYAARLAQMHEELRTMVVQK